MAGSWFKDVPRRLEAECIPEWREATPCVGNCFTATMIMTQTNCPLQPRSSVTDCKDTQPCTCDIADFGLSRGVATCGDCSNVPVGGVCFVGCRDLVTELSGSNKLVCLNTGFFSSVTKPTCGTRIRYCPPIASTGGLNIDMTSFCVGALPGQKCRFNCLPQYYNRQGFYEVTCSSDYTWSDIPQCTCQTPCNLLGECRPQPEVFNVFGQ